MRNILKMILILGLFFTGYNTALAEKLPQKYSSIKFSQINNPSWYKYMSEYRDQLYGAFEPNKFREKKWGQIYIYTIHKGGKITDIKNYSEMDEYDKYIKQVILDNPPPPFPKELEEDNVRIETSLWSANYDSFSIHYYAIKDSFYLSATKNHKHKNKKEIKWKPEDDEYYGIK